MHESFSIWLPPPETVLLKADEVHLWWIDLNRAETDLDRLQVHLTTDELERAARFFFGHHRRKFIAARGILRCLLSRYLSEAPGDIRFQYGPRGKPALAGSSSQRLCFNLSHSGEFALYAFSTRMDLGIDVEFVRPVEDGAQIVERYFSPAEIQVYASITRLEEKQLAFFRGWTRKEAFLKATGQGLAISLNEVEVTLGADEPARFLSLPARFQPLECWQLVDLSLHPAYCGALAINGIAREISHWRWTEQVGI